MRVLLTGHLGYIGTVLTPMLLQAGHDVVGLDSDLYSRCTFREGGAISDVPTIRKDTRDIEVSDLDGFDGLLHLAALSNDPLGNIKLGLTDDINHRASVRIAELAKKAGVRRFVFASSCSNYGKSGENMIDETGALAPVTAYGELKVMSERDISRLAADSFCPRPRDKIVENDIEPQSRGHAIGRSRPQIDYSKRTDKSGALEILLKNSH